MQYRLVFYESVMTRNFPSNNVGRTPGTTSPPARCSLEVYKRRLWENITSSYETASEYQELKTTVYITRKDLPDTLEF